MSPCPGGDVWDTEAVTDTAAGENYTKWTWRGRGFQTTSDLVANKANSEEDRSTHCREHQQAGRLYGIDISAWFKKTDLRPVSTEPICPPSVFSDGCCRPESTVCRTGGN